MSATAPTPATSSETSSETIVSFEGVYKLFGPQPHGYALTLAQQNHLKDEIMQLSGHVLGLQDVNLTVSQGEIFVIMGLSGSGKSTALRCVNQLLATTTGQVWVAGTDVQRLKGRSLQAFRRRQASMVFQHFGLFPHRSVVHNVAYGLKVQGMTKAERNAAAMQALELVGLESYANRFPGQLSGGQQQRVGLARALAAEAGILLMDEPFSALDPLIRHQIQGELVELQRQLQKTILFVTHDLNEAVRLGDRVCIMRGGRVEQVGTPTEILTQPANDYVAGFVRNVDQGRAIQVREVMAEPVALGAELSLAEALARLDGSGSGSGTGSTTGSAAAATSASTGEFVTDAQGAPVALLMAADGLRALQLGTTELSAAWRHDFERTTAGARLNEVYQAAGRGLPIAVVSPEGRLVGTLHPPAIMAKMGATEMADASGSQERYS